MAAKESGQVSGLSLLTRRAFDRRLIQAMLLVMVAIWMFPLIAAFKRSMVGGGWSNYTSLASLDLGGVTVWRTLLNSLIVGGLHAALVVSVALLAGFGFSSLKFRGKEALYYSFIIMLAVPATAVLVPFYVQVRSLGLINSYLGIALPEAALTLPFAVMLVRNFADGLPPALIEAATIDRATPWQVFRTVFLPFARPVALNLSILCLMWSFQDYLFPSYLTTEGKYTTAAKAVQSFKGLLSINPGDIGRYNAALVLISVPALLLVALGTRQITSGLTSGAVKE